MQCKGLVNRYAVTRRLVGERGLRAVEIVAGGLEFAGVGLFPPRYEGEWRQYGTGWEAVRAAIKVADLWSESLGRPVMIGLRSIRRRFFYVDYGEDAVRWLWLWAALEDGRAIGLAEGAERLKEELEYFCLFYRGASYPEMQAMILAAGRLQVCEVLWSLHKVEPGRRLEILEWLEKAVPPEFITEWDRLEDVWSDAVLDYCAAQLASIYGPGERVSAGYRFRIGDKWVTVGWADMAGCIVVPDFRKASVEEAVASVKGRVSAFASQQVDSGC